MKRKGFTLIELMVVVVIIGILAAIAIPNFLAMQDRAKEGSVKNNMHVLQTAVEDFNVRGGYRYPANFTEQIIDANPAYSGYEPNQHISDNYGPPAGSPPTFGNNTILAGNVKNPFNAADECVYDNNTNHMGVACYNYDNTNQSYMITGYGRKGMLDIILTPGIAY
jgi:prepilin-type N-terminal cleavage/methylation domain-containing protein